MAFEKRDMSGSVFPNDRKENEKHADWNGSCLIDGVEYWMNCWDKDGQKGPYRSFSFRRKDAVQPKPSQQRSAVRPAAKQEPTSYDLGDESIPF